MADDLIARFSAFGIDPDAVKHGSKRGIALITPDAEPKAEPKTDVLCTKALPPSVSSLLFDDECLKREYLLSKLPPDGWAKLPGVLMYIDTSKTVDKKYIRMITELKDLGVFVSLGSAKRYRGVLPA